jgi:preprotein translocase subunit YajC
MRDNPGIKASDVAAMIDVKRKEFIENLQTSDLKPGDIVTFADGKKGMVKKSSNEEVTIKMPKVKDALVLNQQDLSKRITMVEAGTVAKAKKEAPMEITQSDKVEVEASKDAVDGFTSNAAKVQELNKDILANTGKDNSANVNNLIDKLGCKTNAKK